METKPLLTIVLLALTGCATSETARTEPVGVRPAPAATQLPGPSPAAVARVAGVRLELRTDIAHPRDLERSLLPLFVQIHNESPRDLLVRPQAFHLISRSGERHQAIPAERLRRPKESPVTSDIAVALAGLPDDVLANGAKTEGFLYFERFEAEPPIGLTFELRAQLGNEYLGLITIPLSTPSNR